MSGSIRFDQLSWHDRRSIFEFAGHSTTLLSVCSGWAGLLRETLEDFCYRETSSPFLPLRKIVAAQGPKNYFVFFRLMNAHLSGQLQKLDPESRGEIFRKFQGSLSPERTLALSDEVASLSCILQVWQEQIHPQAKGDLPEHVGTPRQMRQALGAEENAWRFKTVTTLDLCFQKLFRIPHELFSLRLVTTLDLSNNHLTDLPERFYSTFTQLTELDLTKNPLDPRKYLQIATRLAEMNNLGVLKFEVTEFNIILQHAVQERSALYKVWDSLRKATPDLPALETLAEIREAFKSDEYRQKLLSVHSLNLADRELSVLPTEIFLLENLEALDLSFNPFTVLPPAIAQLKKLKTLDLTHTHIPRGVYAHVCNMLKSCPSLLSVHHHDKYFRFKPKRDLALRPQPLPHPQAQPDEAPLQPRAAWQEARPPQNKFRCEIL